MATKPTQNFSLYLDAYNAEQLRARMKRTGKKVGVLFVEAMQAAADAERQIAGLQAQVEDQAAEIARLEDTEAIGEARYQDGMAAGRAALAQEKPDLLAEIADLEAHITFLRQQDRRLANQIQAVEQARTRAIQEGYQEGVAAGEENAMREMIALSYRDPETLRRMYDEEEAKIRGIVQDQVRRDDALRP